MKTRTLGLMLVGACGAVASVAMADEIDSSLNKHARKDLGDSSYRGIPGRGAQKSTFGDRASINVIVYDTLTNNFAFQGFSLGNCSHLVEDVSFAGGPYGPSFTGTRELTLFNYSYGLTGGTASWDHRWSMYRPSDFSFAGFSGDGSGMINPTATPYYTLTVTGFDTNICPGFTTRTGFFLTPSSVDMPAGDSALMRYLNQRGRP